MRIGILTHTPRNNYGGILQAYALQTVLERMGNDVVVFDKPIIKGKLPLWKKPLSYSRRLIYWYLLHDKTVHLFQERINYQNAIYSLKYTQQFTNRYIHRYLIKDLSEINEKDFDAIVVGSDQIWRMLYFKPMWSNNAADAFLSFTDGWNIKRISYAASFGTDKSEIPTEEVEACKNAISKFDAVSVREKSGVKICKDLFDIDAKWVLDPTMLLSKDDYFKLIGDCDNKPNSKGVLMSYVLDETPDVAELRARIANEKNLKINISNVAERGSEKNGVVPQPPVEHWLQSFLEADYVINDSFHACVFSILFHKQFTVYGNKHRGMERFNSLLRMFGLQDRLVTSSSDYKPLPDIDYNKIDQILIEKRQEAMSFLETNLN